MENFSTLLLALILLIGVVSAQVPTADFTCTPTGFWSRTISCSDQSTGNPTGWAWFFGDEIYKEPWKLQNARADWPARAVNSSVVLSDGSIVLMGGIHFPALSLLNDTWRSTDNGAHWSLLNSYAEWCARTGHSSVVMPDRSIILMGGYGCYGAMNDIWRSIDNGAHWSLLNSHAEWLGRQGHSTVVMPDGSIILMGGNSHYYESIMNDTWRSTDNGAHWSLLNLHAEWPARMGHSSIVMPDGSIVLIGGYDYDSGIMNDTWISADNGAHWSLLNLHAEWPARQGQSIVVMPDGSIVLTGGRFENGIGMNDTWRSTDNGTHWSLLNSHAEWSSRQGHYNLVMPDGSIVLMGGIDTSGERNDTWRFDPAGSRSQNPMHTYSAPGTYNVTLRTYNSQGFSTKQKRVTVSLLPFVTLIAIAGACGIVQLSRKRPQ